MKKFRFSTQKFVKWYPRVKMLEKVVIIEATDSVEARRKFCEQYPDWEVSMFWPL